MGNAHPIPDEDDGPHFSEEEFMDQVQVPRDHLKYIICCSSLVCCPCYYWCCMKPFLPHYRGLPPDSQPLSVAQADEYIRRMEGSFSIAFLDSKTHDGNSVPSYEKVEVCGNKMIFSGGIHDVYHHHGGHTHRSAAANAPLEKYLHFFEGKGQNKVFCDYYGSRIDLGESDFVNQIIFEHCFGYRLRFTRIGQRSVAQQTLIQQPAAPPVSPMSMGMSMNPPDVSSRKLIFCPNCANPKQFADSGFCGKCGTSFS